MRDLTNPQGSFGRRDAPPVAAATVRTFDQPMQMPERSWDGVERRRKMTLPKFEEPISDDAIDAFWRSQISNMAEQFRQLHELLVATLEHEHARRDHGATAVAAPEGRVDVS